MASRAVKMPKTATAQKRKSTSATDVAKSKETDRSDLKLENLQFEKKNEDQKRLPPNAAISRRPILHAPVANPYAGASVPKFVYVSHKTPIMAAVKRVRKLLLQVEKRAMKNVKLVGGPGGDKERLSRVAESSQKSRSEKIYVKATGKAMTQALKVGEWFREKEKEIAVDVEVKTGSVLVVDDIIEKEEQAPTTLMGSQDLETDKEAEVGQNMDVDAENRVPDGGSDDGGDASEAMQTDKEGLATDEETQPFTANPSSLESHIDGQSAQKSKDQTASTDEPEKKRSRASRRRRQKRPMYDEEELPEARTRWVKMVEIAISLKG